MAHCVFCDIVQEQYIMSEISESTEVTSFSPLRPATPGHRLFVPTQHVADAVEDLDVTAAVFRAASLYVRSNEIEANILTSVGSLATQTVKHLHVHVIPRSEKDGLHEDWPWHRDIYDKIRPKEA